MVLLSLAVFTALAAQPPARILIAYHSDTGNTAKLAQAVAKGAESVAGVEVLLRKTTDVKAEEIVRADGILVGTPVHWANVTTETRRFMDRVGEALWQAKTNGDGRTAGAFCTAGGVSMGKEAARLSILSAFLTMRFIAIGGVDAAGFGTLGAEATTGEADPGISEKELDEARRFGERFSRFTLKFRK